MTRGRSGMAPRYKTSIKFEGVVEYIWWIWLVSYERIITDMYLPPTAEPWN